MALLKINMQIVDISEGNKPWAKEVNREISTHDSLRKRYSYSYSTILQKSQRLHEENPFRK